MMMRAKSVVFLALLLSAVQAAAAASPLRPGLWEVVVQADLGGAASAPPPSRMWIIIAPISVNRRRISILANCGDVP